MKVLMISGDAHLLEAGTEANARLLLQKGQVEQLDVFVWPQVHSWREIRNAARQSRYDVVTTQDPLWRGFLGWRIARLTGAKLNVQVHTDLSVQSLFRRCMARFVLYRADSVRVVSEKMRQSLRSVGIKVPIHVLPVYVDVSRFESIIPVSHPQKTILWVGRFEKEKDPFRAIEVLEAVRAQAVDAVLVMLGAGALEPALRRLSAGLPVLFPGWRDPAQHLSTADVVLCTSLYESWGASIIEALAAHVPVVAPDVGIAKEAGAIVVSRDKLATAVVDALHSGARGALKLSLPTAAEWAENWKKTLL